MFAQNYRFWWGKKGLLFIARQVEKFFHEYIHAKPKAFFVRNSGENDNIRLTDDDFRQGEISRLRFGGSENPEFRFWLKDCIDQIPVRSEYFFLVNHIGDYFFIEIELENLYDLVLALNDGTDKIVIIVDFESNQIFEIGNDHEWDSIFVKKHHPEITRENFVKVYDFLENKILVPGDPKLDED
jgi:hypothetical protein